MDAWFQAVVGPVAHGGMGVDELSDVLMTETHLLGCVVSRLYRLLHAIVMSIPLQSACWGLLIRNACILSPNDYLWNNGNVICIQAGVEAYGILLAFPDVHVHVC